MMTSFLGLFSDSQLFLDVSRPIASVADPGAQSGHETQYVFSEGEMRLSDADNVRSRAVGKYFLFPDPLSFSE